VDVDDVTYAREEGRNDDWVPVMNEAEVTDEALVQDSLNDSSIEDATGRLLAKASSGGPLQAERHAAIIQYSDYASTVFW
jgi:hypothetical protein